MVDAVGFEPYDFHRVSVSVLGFSTTNKLRGLPKFAEGAQDTAFCGLAFSHAHSDNCICFLVAAAGAHIANEFLTAEDVLVQVLIAELALRVVLLTKLNKIRHLLVNIPQFRRRRGKQLSPMRPRMKRS
jgi:hypothetical protein